MRKAFFWAVTFLFVFISNAYAVTLLGIHGQHFANKEQIVLDLSAPSQFQQFSLANPPRIVLDFPNSIRARKSSFIVNKGAVAMVRTGYRRKNQVRVVIDLRYVVKANIYTQSVSKGNRQNVIIDIYNQDISTSPGQAPYVVFAGGPLPDAPVHTPAPVSQPITKMESIAPAPVQTNSMVAPVTKLNVTPVSPVTISSLSAMPHKVIKTIPIPTLSRSRRGSSRDIVIAIDPGHGGKDPGAHSRATGLREKDVVLQIARRLKQHLDEKRGFRTIMTRNEDIYIPLRKRMDIARRNGADLFVSIHADAVESTVPRGSSVYILSTKGASSQLAKYLANSENAVDLKWGVDVSKYDNDIQEALLNIQQEATLESSDVLARQTLEELSKIGEIHKPTVERANFVVLRSPEIPSMLVETAFISNPDEARLLASPSYQERLATGIANGIEKYFKEHLPQHMLLNSK